MKWLIRIVCFILTTVIYVPIESALHSVGTHAFLIGIITIIIYLFIFYIPSNALIAMWKKSNLGNRKKIRKLCAFIWSATINYSKSTKVSDDLAHDLCISTALLYSISDILNARQLQTSAKVEFVKTTFKLSELPPDKDLASSMVNLHSFMLQTLQAEHINAKSVQGVTDILKIVYSISSDEDFESNNYVPDPEQQVRLLSAIVSVNNYAVSLFPKQ